MIFMARLKRKEKRSLPMGNSFLWFWVLIFYQVWSRFLCLLLWYFLIGAIYKAWFLILTPEIEMETRKNWCCWQQFLFNHQRVSRRATSFPLPCTYYYFAELTTFCTAAEFKYDFGDTALELVLSAFKSIVLSFPTTSLQHTHLTSINDC